MSKPSELQGQEVCVVDDDPSVLKSTHYLLASEGFKFARLTKLKIFDSRRYYYVPVVVTDIWMDQVTGLEVLAVFALSHRRLV
jgi:FixJ family two-component response regulator